MLPPLLAGCCLRGAPAVRFELVALPWVLGHPRLGFFALTGLGGGCPPSLVPHFAPGYVVDGLVSGVLPGGRSWVGAALNWTLTHTVAPLSRLDASSCLLRYPRHLA